MKRGNIMTLDGLYISGYFSDQDKAMLDCYADELESKSVPFYVRNLSNTTILAAFDYVDFEIISIAYEVLHQFIISGGYDLTKFFFKRLWWNITKGRESDTPFTISIEGIPTVTGPTTIKCKTEGRFSDQDKDKALDKTFTLAFQIENHQYQLMEKNQYYDALGGHLFRYDADNEELHEIDVAEELKKKTERLE